MYNKYNMIKVNGDKMKKREAYLKARERALILTEFEMFNSDVFGDLLTVIYDNVPQEVYVTIINESKYNDDKEDMFKTIEMTDKYFKIV